MCIRDRAGVAQFLVLYFAEAVRQDIPVSYTHLDVYKRQVLNKKKIKETYGIVIPHWEESLRVCMEKL